jgi:hypothetical protein
VIFFFFLTCPHKRGVGRFELATCISYSVVPNRLSYLLGIMLVLTLVRKQNVSLTFNQKKKEKRKKKKEKRKKKKKRLTLVSKLLLMTFNI